MLFFSAVAATGAGRFGGRSRTEKSEITKTSRKKADYYRELAG